MDKVEKLIDTILEKCSNCKDKMPVYQIAEIFMGVVNIMMEESESFKKLKNNDLTEDDFFKVITSFLCTFLTSIYANAGSKNIEDAERMAKDLGETK